MGFCGLSVISGLRVENVGSMINVQHATHESEIVKVSFSSCSVQVLLLHCKKSWQLWSRRFFGRKLGKGSGMG